MRRKHDVSSGMQDLAPSEKEHQEVRGLNMYQNGRSSKVRSCTVSRQRCRSGLSSRVRKARMT